MRVVVISGDDAHHRHLVWRLLQEGFDVVQWIVEPEAARRRRALAQRRWRDWLAAGYHVRRRQITGLDAYRRGAFALPEEMPAVLTTVVDSVNGRAAHALLDETGGDVTVIIGCGILSPETLERCTTAVVNIHGGHLPQYRGNHCIFFALEDGRPALAGATIHHVDRGIDTGDLIDVIRVEVMPGDLAEHVYCRAEHKAFDQLIIRLKEMSAGIPLPRHPQPGPGRTHRTRDRTPVHDLRAWARRRRRAAKT